MKTCRVGTAHLFLLCASWLTVHAVANGASGEPSRLRFGLVLRAVVAISILARSASERAPHLRFDHRNSAGLDGAASNKSFLSEAPLPGQRDTLKGPNISAQGNALGDRGDPETVDTQRFTLVPTLRVGMPSTTLRVVQRSQNQGRGASKTAFPRRPWERGWVL